MARRERVARSLDRPDRRQGLRGGLGGILIFVIRLKGDQGLDQLRSFGIDTREKEMDEVRDVA